MSLTSLPLSVMDPIWPGEMLIFISTPVSIYWSMSFKGQNADTPPSHTILSPGTGPIRLATIQQDLDLPMFLTTEPQDHPQVPGAYHAVVVPVPMGTMPQDPDHTLDLYPFPQAGLLFGRISPKPSLFPD